MLIIMAMAILFRSAVTFCCFNRGMLIRIHIK